MNGQPEPSNGRLVVKTHGETGERVLRVDTGGRRPTNVDLSTLDASLRSRFDAGEDLEDEVWCEAPAGGNRVRFVRPVGTDRPRPVATEQPRPAEPPMPAQMGPFLNPYNFVPTKERSGAPDALGDSAQVSHGTLHSDRYSGTISLSIETATPLLLPDTYRAEWAQGHGTFPVSVDSDGLPFIHPTAVKGMLRSAFEAVTGSRFGVFTGHDDPLPFRKVSRSALDLVPVRLVDDGTKVEQFKDAAWLPIRRNNRTVNESFEHGAEVKVEVERWRIPRVRGDDSGYWLVVDGLDRPGLDGHRREPEVDRRTVQGRVHKMGWNFNQKHDDRVFFDIGARRLDVPPEVLGAFAQLIADYRATHKVDLERQRRAPGGVDWSRQVKNDQYKVRTLDSGKFELEKPDGITCWARLEGQQVVELVPVMVSRGLYPETPLDLLHPTLRPAVQATEMSPADRVFGWVSPDGEGGRRGQVSVGSVRCIAVAGERPVRPFQPALPLQILSSPKPNQGRFYLGDDWNEPLEERLHRSAMYCEGQHLRGRKFYPHHAGIDGEVAAQYWSDGQPLEAVATPSGTRYREFIRPQPSPKNGVPRPRTDDQNRSVSGWVEPGTSFKTDLKVENLSLVELGALLWLCDLDSEQGEVGQPRHHRLGGGKPLGFGSVALSVETSQLSSGTDIRDAYQQLRLRSGDAPQDLKLRAVDAFQRAIEQWFGRPFAVAPPIAAFLAMAEGNPDHPVRYPRVRRHGDPNLPPPHRDGENYRWFVANDKIQRGEVSEGKSLPLPGTPLPTYPA